MENTLITEINRIHTLMGVESKILNESVVTPISKALGSLYDLVARKLLDDVATATPNPRGGVNINGKTYAQADFDELNNIAKALDNGTIDSSELSEYLKILPKSTQNVLAQIIKNSEGAVDDFYQQFIKSIYNQPNSVFKTEEECITAILNKIKNEGKTIDQVLDEIFTEENFTLKRVLEDKIKKNIIDLNDGKFKPSVSRRITETITLSADEITSLNKTVMRLKGPSVFLGKIKDISNKSYNDLLNSTTALDNGFREACKGKSADELIEITNAYGLQMNRVVNEFHKKFGTDYKAFLKEAGVDEQLIKKITTPTKEDGYFWAWKQLRDNRNTFNPANSEDWLSAWKSFTEEMGRLWDDIKPKNWIDPETNFVNFQNRFLSLLATGQMDTYQKWIRRSILTGYQRGKFGWCRFLIASVAYGSMLLAGSTIALTIVETLWSLIWSAGVGSVNLLRGEFGKEPYETRWNKSEAVGPLNKIIDIATQHMKENFSYFFGDDGFINILLGLIPGGIGTLQNGWIQQAMVGLGASEKPNTFPDVISYLLSKTVKGLSSDDKNEAEKELKENPPQDSPGTEGRQGGPRETEPSTKEEFPQDLLDVMNDEKENELIRDGENIYWGSKDYPIKKSQNGIWKVKKDGKWYDINENM
jgi:hypothetical protein